MLELDDCFPGIALSYNLSEISSVLDDCDYCPWTLRGFGFFFRPVFKRIATVMIFKTLCDKRILCVSAPVSVKTMLLLFLKCVRLIY